MVLFITLNNYLEYKLSNNCINEESCMYFGGGPKTALVFEKGKRKISFPFN